MEGGYTEHWTNVFFFSEGYKELFTGEAEPLGYHLYQLPAVWIKNSEIAFNVLDKTRPDGDNNLNQFKKHISTDKKYNWTVRFGNNN